MSQVFLGFCEEANVGGVEGWLQSRCGGLPGWLHPDGLKHADFICSRCANPLIFLLQIYSPRESEHTFHRLLYVFACWQCGKDVRCFRQCADRGYGLLPSDPSDPKGADMLNELKQRLVTEAGCCEHCLVPCAGSESQRLHKRCANAIQGHLQEAPVLPRQDIFVEVENGTAEDDEAGDEVEDATTAPQYQAVVSKAIDQDPVLDAYIDYMNRFPGHVIRYGGKSPIWFCSQEQWSDEVSCCSSCGKKRAFEFQVQSSLIDGVNLLTNLEVGFGILAVYTCEQDCENHAEEFIYKQRDPTIDLRIRLCERQ